MLYKIFDIANDNLFNNELKQCQITIQSRGKKKCMAWCTVNKIWRTVTNTTEDYYEINICAEYTDGGIQVIESLLHEMVHLYNIQHDIKDVNGRQRHLEPFRDECIEIGLNCEATNKSKNNWNLTSLSDSLIDKIENDWIKNKNINYNVFNIAREDCENTKKQGQSTKHTFLWHCPQCKQRIKGDEQLEVICAKCNKKFEKY